jgi:lipid-A-disaccharide synthase-like uncharacterized protein
MERRASEINDKNNGAKRDYPSAKHFELCGIVCGALWSSVQNPSSEFGAFTPMPWAWPRGFWYLGMLGSALSLHYEVYN